MTNFEVTAARFVPVFFPATGVAGLALAEITDYLSLITSGVCCGPASLK